MTIDSNTIVNAIAKLGRLALAWYQAVDGGPDPDENRRQRKRLAKTLDPDVTGDTIEEVERNGG